MVPCVRPGSLKWGIPDRQTEVNEMAPGWIALIIVAAAALLLAVGAYIFRNYTRTLRAMYANGKMPRPGTDDPPTYADWYNGQSWWVQVPAVEPED